MLAESTQILSVERYPMSTNTQNRDLPGELVMMKLMADSPAELHIMQYMAYDTDYLIIPRCPSTREELKASGFSDKQIETAWLSFKKYAKKCISGEPIRFSREDCMKYNIHPNGLIAIYAESEVKIAKPSGILIEKLPSLGFKLDENLFVPFAEKEAYYNKESDNLLVLW